MPTCMRRQLADRPSTTTATDDPTTFRRFDNVPTLPTTLRYDSVILDPYDVM